MAGATFDVGMLATHSRMTDWGPGKVVKVRPPYVWVFFRDAPGRASRQFPASLLLPADCQSDTVLDNLPEFVEKDGVHRLPAERFTLREALAVFEANAPGGFTPGGKASPQKARDRRRAAHESWLANLGGGVAEQLLAEDSIADLGTRALAVVALSGALSSGDAAALRAGLQDEARARAYFTALLPYVAGDPTEAGFEAYAAAASALASRPDSTDASWPLVTLLPFLAAPERHMLLQPAAACAAAQRLAFDLPFTSAPNWETYEAFCRMGGFYLEALRDAGARDNIDVALFLTTLVAKSASAALAGPATDLDGIEELDPPRKLRPSRPRGAALSPGPARRTA